MTCFQLKMALKILLDYSSTLETDSSKNLVQRGGRGELWYAKLSLVLDTVKLFIEKVYLIGGWMDRLVGDWIIYR